MKAAALIVHGAHATGGTVPDILRSHGFQMTRHICPENAERIGDPDLLVVMGGPMGVYEKADYPFLKTEIEILQRRLDGGRPTLGICLGAQLMAAALGAEVYKGAQGPEIGWHDLNVAAPENHPLRHLDAQYTKIMQWHGDTFDLPRGTVLLASSSHYAHQAFAFGAHGLALQCHPETNAAIAARWADEMDEGDLLPGETLEEKRKMLKAGNAAHIMTLGAQMKSFMQDWLAGLGLA